MCYRLQPQRTPVGCWIDLIKHLARLLLLLLSAGWEYEAQCEAHHVEAGPNPILHGGQAAHKQQYSSITSITALLVRGRMGKPCMLHCCQRLPAVNPKTQDTNAVPGSAHI